MARDIRGLELDESRDGRWKSNTRRSLRVANLMQAREAQIRVIWKINHSDVVVELDQAVIAQPRQR